MTLLEFIKSKLSENTPIGDLATDIQRDKAFPFDKTEEEIISYLYFKTRRGGTEDILDNLIESYKKQLSTSSGKIDIEAKFALLRSENWKFYKEHFPVDEVILVGRDSDLYKSYCVDTTRKKALYFNMKSETSLNDIQMVDVETIHIGNLTKRVSVKEAIKLLEGCIYDTPIKPNRENFSELIEFLKTNI